MQCNDETWHSCSLPKEIQIQIAFWFNFNNQRLALGLVLDFYTSVAKALKLKVGKFWGIIPMFEEVQRKKIQKINKSRDTPHEFC